MTPACDVCDAVGVPLTVAIVPFRVCADCAEAWDDDAAQVAREAAQ